MELATTFAVRAGRNHSPGLTTTFAAILVVAVLASVGVGTYGVMGGFSKHPPIDQCAPITSPACARYENLHDVSVFAPFKSATQNAQVSFTAAVPSGETATSYTFSFGDGSTAKTTNSISSHAYAWPGTYLVFAQAAVNGLTHDNLPALIALTIIPASTVGNIGSTASIAASIISNSTAAPGTRGVTSVLSPGGSVTFSGSYSSQPTNPSFSTLPPTIAVSTGGHLTAGPNSSTSAQATAQFTTSGVYEVTFVGKSHNATSTVLQNYTWTVFVASAGNHAGIYGTVAPKSPHPGTIIGYELAPGGAASEDPAIDYETVGAEPIFNVYQTLITYNGTKVGPDPTNFVPEAATCVPGSAQCTALYHDSLQNKTDYTFVIQRNATFYDPGTGARWAMYPTDVVFSIARTLGFSTLPAPTVHNGWIIAQSLLDQGNLTWNLIHGAYNNTPQRILNSMTINGTACPAAGLSNDHGCVTFHANGGGHPWPDFLELVADPLGGGIVSCGWFSARGQGAGIPYWTSGNISGAGDQPCGAIGTHGLGAPVLTNYSEIPATGWDQWEELGSGSFNGRFLGNVQWSMLGSGPYYMSAYIIGASYELKANPAYSENPYCTWAGCQPKAKQYASTIDITWETSETPGEQAYRFGSADFANIPLTSIGLLLQLISQGKVNALQAPTLNIGFSPFNMEFNLPTAQKLSTNAITIPIDFFSYLGMREFFALAYPYATIENTIQTKNGIQFSFNMGGAIPQFMGNYDPTNIPWPSADPCSTPNHTNKACPDYWWAQMQNPSGPYYDPELRSCSSGSPCAFPIFGQTGNPTGDEINSLWESEIASLSGGSI
ncbi:MAG: PKD domain-containing protein, partial [Thermoplasmata archaeon]|nr:PKD domain-containing protein [Thermoplasmata archaeon]